MTTQTVLRAQHAGRFVFLCDHASNAIPDELRHLGLPRDELERHIAWDIGAAGVTEALSEIFDAPAVLCGTSRLVIDANRHRYAPDLIPEVSDTTVIPGNRALSDSARTERVERWFRPYHDAVEAILNEREEKGIPSCVISIHSMAARLRSMASSMGDNPRPWQISICSHLDRTLADPVLKALRNSGDIVVGDNQPYDLNPAEDYSVPYHALRRGLQHLQVEFRQDEISDPPRQRQWAARFAAALTAV